MGAKWGTLGPWKAQTEAAAIAPNQKVVDKFFLKVCAEGEVARQGVWPQCPVSPLLSSADFFLLLLFKSFSSFLSLTLSFFLPLLFYFLSFPSCFSLSFSLLTSYYLSLSPSLPAFLTFLSPFLFRYPSLSFVSFPLPPFSLFLPSSLSFPLYLFF